jgi:hypothetical protein
MIDKKATYFIALIFILLTTGCVKEFVEDTADVFFLSDVIYKEISLDEPHAFVLVGSNLSCRSWFIHFL